MDTTYTMTGGAITKPTGLTPDEKQTFNIILRRFDTRAVETFITKLNHLLLLAAILLGVNKPDTATVRRHKKATLKALDRAIDHIKLTLLESIPTNDDLFKSVTFLKLFDKFGYVDEIMLYSFKYSPLIKMRDALEKELSGGTTGRPPGSATLYPEFTKDIIAEIVVLYSNHIGKPTSYKEGPFFEVVQTSLQLLDLPHQDPSRLIKAVLESQS